MRDRERIPVVTKALEECWRECPDQRFGQLIEIIYTMRNNPKVDMWTMEENEWMEAIHKFKERYVRSDNNG